jgi:3-methyladenine DNA glycosylase/8-oxoguanine DNA glycosylase
VRGPARRADSLEFPLSGPGGEPVDLAGTFGSHGLTSLPPMRRDGETLEVTLPLNGFEPRTVRIRQTGSGYGAIEVAGGAPEGEERDGILAGVRWMLRLDEDLSPFYEMAAADPELSWVTRGAGRLVRSPTIFEEVVKTICTTNCSWSATGRMIRALVEHLGERATGSPTSGPHGRAFPTPEAMAQAGEDFYRDVVKAGYRGRYLISLSKSIAEGAVDLEALGEADMEELPDEELERLLLALPGVGPYAAAHIMMMLGRYSRLILDSWTRPTYARVVGGPLTDAEIQVRFSKYGRYAGLAFWLSLDGPGGETGVP